MYIMRYKRLDCYCCCCRMLFLVSG